ncbi:MAG: glycerol-3-phosphate cytidylyltransferase [Actinobacteria bacterium]|nr:glycerol-3-phosphate cytidylyltransferase [Actinomycetota bacterium]|tara:strand:+ start:4542 stop:4985 length:444 start_codon:yes stop_codon:yes gene_type:complete
MTEKTLVIVSGYFSPLHCGHLDYLEAGASLGDRLVVIVNNDLQQKKKKGKVILPQQDRLRIVKALSIVDEACVAIDDDSSVKKTIESIALKNQQFNLMFANGGDRNQPSDIPEVDVCKEHKIQLIFGVGGSTKRDSSTRINTELGIE